MKKFLIILCMLVAIIACDDDNDKECCITVDDDKSVIVIAGKNPTPTPEPCSMILLGTGLVATGIYFKKRKK